MHTFPLVERPDAQHAQSVALKRVYGGQVWSPTPPARAKGRERARHGGEERDSGTDGNVASK